jgi:hypothetical protein
MDTFGSLPRGVNQPGRETGSLHKSSAEVNNICSCNSTPPIRLHGVMLNYLSHRGNLTLLCNQASVGSEMKASHVIILSCTSQTCGSWVRSNGGMLISRGNRRNSEKKLLRCHVVQELPGNEPDIPRWQATPTLPHIFTTLHFSNMKL